MLVQYKSLRYCGNEGTVKTYKIKTQNSTYFYYYAYYDIRITQTMRYVIR